MPCHSVPLKQGAYELLITSAFTAEQYLLLMVQSTSCWEIPYWSKAFQVLLYKQLCNRASCMCNNNCTCPFSGFFNPGGVPGSYNAAGNTALDIYWKILWIIVFLSLHTKPWILQKAPQSLQNWVTNILISMDEAERFGFLGTAHTIILYVILNMFVSENWTARQNCVAFFKVLRARLQVRWADLEAKKEEERQKREVGFCIGGTWGQVTEEEAQAILRGTSPTSGGRDWGS